MDSDEAEDEVPKIRKNRTVALAYKPPPKESEEEEEAGDGEDRELKGAHFCIKECESAEVLNLGCLNGLQCKYHLHFKQSQGFFHKSCLQALNGGTTPRVCPFCRATKPYDLQDDDASDSNVEEE
uniref:RING-type domain-containing protein n=1 Tax=Panagrolaimus davidi TaxID=227884 RepID=A0A914QG19_9BILA